MIRVRRQYLVIGLAALILALAGGTAFAATHPPVTASSATPPTPIVTNYTPQPSGVGATKTTDEGLAITLVQIVKNGPRWLFQFQIRNIAHKALIVRGTTDEHQFVVSGNTGDAPPNNIGTAQLASPSASEIAASYSDLATSLQADGTEQGWLAVDITNLGFTPIQLLYRDVAVPTKACTNPADQSTCQPATLYTGVDWVLG